MRKKIAVGIGLVAVMLVGLAIVAARGTPRLREGMSVEEVEKVMGKCGPEISSPDGRIYRGVVEGPDLSGNSYLTVIYFDSDYRVVSWNTSQVKRPPQPWSDRIRHFVCR